MELRTTVDTGMQGFSIRPGERLTLMGSCFAENMGRRMERAGLDVHVNPFGVLYNPLSIAAWCAVMAAGEGIPDDCFFESGGMWNSWLNDSSFSSESLEECQARLAAVCRTEAERLRALDKLFITLGTNRYYRLSDNGRVVGNCHKQPAKCFREEELDVEETVDALDKALASLWAVAPSLQVVFTVSPYRYAKYGFHGSQLGKSVLLLATDALCRRHERRCFYFPAYEIVLDELRDYRFYAADMLHPSEVAVEYIWERFSVACFTAETRGFIAEWEAVEKAFSHRPLHPESAAYRSFQRQTMLKLERLMEKYPKLVQSTAYQRLKGQIKY